MGKKKTTSLRFCAVCKYFKGIQVDGLWANHSQFCVHPNNTSNDLVTGQLGCVDEPRVIRSNRHKCGPTGLWWEEK